MDDNLSSLGSVAMTEATDIALRRHLLRDDGDEDLCFALYRPSRGRRRFTALLSDVLLPQASERQVHGNASLNPEYLERAIAQVLIFSSIPPVVVQEHSPLFPSGCDRGGCA